MIILMAIAALSDDCCASMKDFTKDPEFRAEHLSPENIDFAAQHGKMGKVKVPGGTEANVFIVPSKEGTKAAVVMIHEWWGSTTTSSVRPNGSIWKPAMAFLLLTCTTAR